MAKKKRASKPSPPPQRLLAKNYWPWLLALFGFLLYANTLGHLYAIDDNLVIYGHDYVEKGLAGTKGIFTTPFTYGTSKLNDRGYRPIPLMVFALQIQIFGKNSFFAQHFIQVLFYALTCFFLFLLLRRLLQNHNPLFPLLISLLYIAHPIHTEVVANLKSLDEILGFLLGFLLTTYAMYRYLDTQKPLYLALGYLAYLFGMFSKENVITYLVIIPLTLFVFSPLNWRQIARLCWPLAVIALGYVMVREMVLSQYPIPEYDMMQNILMGAKTWIIRQSTAMLVMLRYLGLLFFPHPLAWDYSYNQIPLTDLSDWRVWFSILAHVALFGYALWKIREKDLFAYGILFYLTIMSINSNLFIMTNCTLGERFLYAPSLGFAIVVVGLLLAFFRVEAIQKYPKIQAQLALVMIALLLPMSIKTVVRNRDWKDSLSVSLADIQSSPESIRVVSTLAAVYLALTRRKDTPPEARKELFRQIIPLAHRILKLSPGHKEATYNLGICYYFLGDFSTSEKAFNEHLKLHPTDVRAYNNLGGLYYFRKDYRTAMTYFHKFVDAKQQELDKLLAKTPVHFKDRKTKERRDKEVREVRIELKKAINNLGVVTLDNLRQPREAIAHFQRALEIDPQYAEPVKRWADALVAQGQVFKAIELYRKAHQLDPVQYKNVGPLIQSAFQRFRGNRSNQPWMRGKQFGRFPRSFRGKPGQKWPPHLRNVQHLRRPSPVPSPTPTSKPKAPAPNFSPIRP